ncbi:hypothetical protein BOTBODRAFT_338042 [Botryobasidium botryosum FD-172 SS1]|uniref:Uncharacterized protein n=1 Tax=Botryobasidium botryosum (strain FD-172 SS1) TaxID=930990 RepID=A0A067MGK9_BOTB1|nr:hypothetical protein BOTBODRAFT_338042 [Botryobasidium botryosum FD-172 SS1]
MYPKWYGGNHWILYILPRIEVPVACQLWVRGSITGQDGDLRQLLPEPSHNPLSMPMMAHISQLNLLLGREDANKHTLKSYIPDRGHHAIRVKFEGWMTDKQVTQRVVSNLGSVLPMPSLKHPILSSLIVALEPGLISALTGFLHSHSAIDAITLVDSAVQLLELLVVTPGRILCPLLDTLHLGGDDGSSKLDESTLLEGKLSDQSRQ